MTDQWDAPLAPGACPWCSATNTPDARTCRSCGAAIAQRDDLGGVVVPGVTGVDPNLLGAPGSIASPVLRSQGTMGALNAVSQVNATLGLAAAAAILGQDTVKGMLGLKDADLDAVGKPSEAALQAFERLERDADVGDARDSPEEASKTPAPDPWSDLPGG
jgi:testis-expressed sequence 13 family protein